MVYVPPVLAHFDCINEIVCSEGSVCPVYSYFRSSCRQNVVAKRVREGEGGGGIRESLRHIPFACTFIFVNILNAIVPITM